MSNLVRTKQGVFNIESSYTLKDIENGKFKILKIKDVLDIPKIKIDENIKKKIINGCKLKGDYPNMVLFLDENDNELAIYEKQNNIYKIKVLLYENI